MIRWLSIGVIFYMILGIIWWGMLLTQKNSEIYQLQKKFTISEENLLILEKEHSKQTFMILGEGFVLGCSLLLGIYIINRSASKEIQSARQQSDFLLSVSHELKSPIAAIKLALQTLIRPGITQEKEMRFRNSALDDTKRLEKLVQNILLSANIDSNGLELYKTEVNLNKLIGDLVGMYQNEYSGKSFNVTSVNPNIIISVDRQNLKQAIGNIIDNAIKYSNDENAIEIDIIQNDDHVICAISNIGIPIESYEISRIFEKFYRGSSGEVRKNEGTGIGLYITNEIIKAHSGKIEVNSINGKNTFSIILPKYG